MIKDYLIQDKLGTGSYGIVYKVTKKDTNDFYVIKQISLFGLTPEQINEVKLEAKILSKIESIYVVKYYDSFEEKNFLNIVMEYCDGGDLGKFLDEKKKTNELLNEDLIWTLFIKITIGLASIHKSKILHRDLKTLNIFLTKQLDVKIGDLGVAKMLNQTNSFAKTLIGTPYYLSPELCEEKPYNNKSDVWALGCILYELCTYKHPFNAKSQGALILKILQDTPEPIDKKYSNELQKLSNDLLEKNDLKRLSCYDILKLPIVLEKAKKIGVLENIKFVYPDIMNENLNINISNNISSNKLNIIYHKNKNVKGDKQNIIKKRNNIVHTTGLNSKNGSIYEIDNISSNNHKIANNLLIRNSSKKSQISNSNAINYNNDINQNKNNPNYKQVLILNNKPMIKKVIGKRPASVININGKNPSPYHCINKETPTNKNIKNVQLNGIMVKKDKLVKYVNKSNKQNKYKLSDLTKITNNNLFNIDSNGNSNNISHSNVISHSNNKIIKTCKSATKRIFVPQKPKNILKQNENNNEIINNNVNISKNINNNIFNIKYNEYNEYKNINTRLSNNVINHNNIVNLKNIENINNNNNEKKYNNKQLEVHKSIEEFEKKLKKYYLPPENIKKNVNTPINMQQPYINKQLKFDENSDKNNAVKNINPMDIINNKEIDKVIEKNLQQKNDKNQRMNDIMEFVKNLNEYIPQYKINNNNHNNCNNNNNHHVNKFYSKKTYNKAVMRSQNNSCVLKDNSTSNKNKEINKKNYNFIKSEFVSKDNSNKSTLDIACLNLNKQNNKVYNYCNNNININIINNNLNNDIKNNCLYNGLNSKPINSFNNINFQKRVTYTSNNYNNYNKNKKNKNTNNQAITDFQIVENNNIKPFNINIDGDNVIDFDKKDEYYYKMYKRENSSSTNENKEIKEPFNKKNYYENEEDRNEKVEQIYENNNEEKKSVLITELNSLKDKENKIKKKMYYLLGENDYKYVMNLLKWGDKLSNRDEFCQKIETFASEKYNKEKKENFDDMYYQLISIYCQINKKEKQIKNLF